MEPLAGLPERYTLISQIGCGGMGQVFEAHDNKLERVVALKTLRTDRLGDERVLERFRLEAQSLAKINHPSIVPVHDIGSAANSIYYTMDLIEGNSLAQLIKMGPLSEEECIEIAKALTDALRAVHRASLVHRDIKPENIIITERGDVYLIDFGLVKSFSRENTARLTKSRELVGTLLYMSPEQILGQKVGPRSDIFQLGLTLYESVTGKRAFNPLHIAAIAREADELPITAPSELKKEISPTFEKIICKALEYDPTKRWQSANAIHKELYRVNSLEDDTVCASKPSGDMPRASERWLYKPLLFFALALILGLLLLSGPKKDYRISKFIVDERGVHSALVSWQSNWSNESIELVVKGGGKTVRKKLKVIPPSSALLDALEADCTYEIALLKGDGETSMPITFTTRKDKPFAVQRGATIFDNGAIDCTLESYLPFRLVRDDAKAYRRKLSVHVPIEGPKSWKPVSLTVQSIDKQDELVELDPRELTSELLKQTFSSFLEAHERRESFRNKIGDWIDLTKLLSRNTTKGALAGEWQLLWSGICKYRPWARKLSGQLPGVFRILANESTPNMVRHGIRNSLVPLILLNEAARWSHLDPNPEWNTLLNRSRTKPFIKEPNLTIKGQLSKAPTFTPRVLLDSYHPHIKTLVAEKTLAFAAEDLVEFDVPQGLHKSAELELTLYSSFRGSAVVAEFGDGEDWAYFLSSDRQWEKYNTWLIETGSFGSILLAFDDDYTNPKSFSRTSALIKKMCPPWPNRLYQTIPVELLSKGKIRVKLRVISGPIKEPQGVIFSSLMLRLES